MFMCFFMLMIFMIFIGADMLNAALALSQLPTQLSDLVGHLQMPPLLVMGGIMMLMFGSVAAVGLNTLIKARVDLEEPRNLVIVSSVLVMGIGGLALNFDGLTLQGVSLCGVVAVVLNLILPRVRAGA